MAEASSRDELPPEDVSSSKSARSAGASAARFAGAFLLLWLVFGWIAVQLPTLPDTDSYYHLAIARIYAHDGVVDQLPWLRFSLLQGVEDVGFGDKEFLFHLLLAPFTLWEGMDGGTEGGRWALAFWNALAFTTLAAAGRAAIGRWGLLAPCLLWLGSLDFLGRLIRLRPETPALILFVVAALCAGHRRYRLLGLVMMAFTLTYTAFHALAGLCFLWFLWQAWEDRRAGEPMPWQGLAYPTMGAGLGLLLHPHFPQNLVVWKVQSLDFFRFKDQLDVGNEIGAGATDQILLQNLPWLAGCVVLLLAALTRRPEERVDGSSDASRPEPGPRTKALKETADTLTIAAGCFGVLFLLMSRFSTHALPLLTLALVFRLAAAGRRPGRRLLLPGGVRVPTALALGLVLAAGAWRSAALIHGQASAPEREPEWRAFGEAIPDGAHVAAPWGQTPQYFYWAPTAKFLNDLDPVFMAVPYPEAYWLQRSVFEGTEPDVPMAVVAGLDSDYLAMSRFLMPPELAARLTGDPRARLVYDDWNLLFHFAPPPPEARDSFLVDWRLVPQGSELPVSLDTEIGAWDPYPLNPDPALRQLEAFVDGRRVPTSGRCFAVVGDLEPGSHTGHAGHSLELAAAGPTTLWFQTRRAAGDESTERLQVLGSPGAILGRGVLFSVDGMGQPTRLSVVSCLAQAKSPQDRPRIGFYLRRVR